MGGKGTYKGGGWEVESWSDVVLTIAWMEGEGGGLRWWSTKRLDRSLGVAMQWAKRRGREGRLGGYCASALIWRSRNGQVLRSDCVKAGKGGREGRLEG